MGLLVPYLFWIYVGTQGRWQSWPARIHVVNSRRAGGGLVRVNRRDGFVRHPWRREREGWLRAGNRAAMLYAFMFLAYVVSSVVGV